MSDRRGSQRAAAIALAAVFALGMVSRFAATQYLDVSDRYSYDDSGYLTFDGRRGDDREYEGRGWNLVSGGDFWALPSGDGNAPPGFPLLIALVYAVTGRDVTALLILNALAGGATAVLTYFLARSLVGPPAGMAAALFVAFDPLLVFSATRVLAETVTVLLCVTVLLGAVWFRSGRPAYWRGIMLGLLMAAAILTRNQLAAIAGATALWLMVQEPTGWPGRRAALLSMAACAALVLATTVLGARNRPAGTTHQMQQMVADGYLSSRGYVDVSLDRAARVSGGSLSAEERDQVTKAAEAYVAAMPGWRVLALTWYERFRIFWQLEPAVGTPAERLIYTATTVGLLSLGAAGILLWLFGAADRRQAIAGAGGLLLLACLAVTALHILVHAKPRYRLPLHPVLAIWAAYALQCSGERFRRFFRLDALDRRSERIAT